MAECPWDTRPVSRQRCPFLSVFSKQITENPWDTPASRPLFVPPGVPATPGRCPGDFFLSVYVPFSFLMRGTIYSATQLSSLLRGPATILLISRDACSDSIAKVFRACFWWDIAQSSRDTLQNEVSHRCACVKLSTKGGIAPFWGSADLPWKVSRNMGYRSDRIAVSRDMGPLNLTPNPSPRETNRNRCPFAKTSPSKDYPLVSARIRHS